MERPKINGWEVTTNENGVKMATLPRDTMEEILKYLEYADKQLRLNIVSKSLSTKKYKIDFGGDFLAGLEITNNEPKIIGAMNGWGNGISKDEITITEK